MLSSRRPEPTMDIGMGNVFEPPGERNFRRERTLSKFLDALNEVGTRQNPDEVDPIGLYHPGFSLRTGYSTHRLFLKL
jgi:hypothetical protein